FYKAFIRKDASDRELVLVGRLAVLAISLIALIMALHPNETILNLVGYAWAGFGAAFGPVVLLSLYWKRMTKWGALSGMLAGALTVIAWEQVEAFRPVYEIIPGFIVCTAVIIVVSLLTKKPPAEIEDEFDTAVENLKG
ncbi:sodium:proline symporter, partial [Klebsiella pneumoniae]|nr:sodium:proline symporter [Klebsiella pneumoniae]